MKNEAPTPSAAQVLFGFQFDGMFQEAFDDLHLPVRLIACAGLILIMIPIGLMRRYPCSTASWNAG